jgi:putative transposase
MARKKRVQSVSLETIWEIPDNAWELIVALLNDLYPPARTGRPRTDLRKALNGIIFRMRTGCQWNQLPKMFGDDSSVHRWFQRWVRDGVFEALWATLITDCEELEGVDWRWQAADCCLSKARFEGEKRGQTRQIGENRVPRRASSSKPRAVLSL